MIVIHMTHGTVFGSTITRIDCDDSMRVAAGCRAPAARTAWVYIKSNSTLANTVCTPLVPTAVPDAEMQTSQRTHRGYNLREVAPPPRRVHVRHHVAVLAHPRRSAHDCSCHHQGGGVIASGPGGKNGGATCRATAVALAATASPLM